MARRTIRDIEKIWSNVEGIKKLSDRVIPLGPFGIGLDGLLTWFPGVGLIYSVGAGGILLTQAVRARATAGTLARMAGYLLFDSATSEVPVVGDAVDLLFPGHLLAAKALQKHIETTHWVEDSRRRAVEMGEHDDHLAVLRDNTTKRRVIYLHDD